MPKKIKLYKKEFCTFLIIFFLLMTLVASCEPAYAIDIKNENIPIAKSENTKVIVITEPCNKTHVDEVPVDEQLRKKYLGAFTVTHYCPYGCCNGKWDGKTASGAIPTPWHTIAVDKRVIPIGSKVHIEGYGDFVAQDCGGSIKGSRIDVLVGSHKEALSLGIKEMEVYLVW